MNKIVSLSKIFDGAVNRASVAFIREKETIDWHVFEQDVAFTVSKLIEHPQKKWLLFCDDIYWFMVGFTALSYAAKDIILPPNMQQGSLKDMEDEVDACLTDRITSDLSLASILLEKSSGKNIKLNAENYSNVNVTLKTSGTTGSPKHIKKRISQLETEVFKLDEKWQLSGHNIIMASTVSHFHIYGLLYQIIWPLMSGLSIYCIRLDYPEQLSELSAGTDFNLISSPAYLKRWQKDLSHYKAPRELKLIFSSGGKLPENVGAKLSDILSVPIYEIYGSTETGGIATRQCAKDNYWTGISGVSLRCNENELLEVLSDHTGSTDWITMGDKVQFHNEDQFSIIGRADRIEKVEEKRLSLVEMEKHLMSLEEIDEVRVEILRQQNRDTVGVAVVLSKKGNDLLNSVGKKQLTTEFNHKLKAYYEAVLLPRKWRFIETMPYNSQGKIEQHSILELFKISNYPEIKNINYQGDKLILDIHIKEDLDCFKGHFEGYPIVPGVIQLDWASYYAGKYLNMNSGFGGAEAIKFIKIISPDEDLTLILEQKNNKIYFCYKKNHEIYSSGRLLLGKKMNKYCIIIPVYNHETYIGATVDKIEQFQLPCILIDDGSDQKCNQVLKKLSDEKPWLSLIVLEKNSGKGGAVKAGLREAYANGYSHALQIDADGQHDVSDIPKMLELSSKHPLTLISGKPLFDETIPKGRYYGRYLTHALIWLETLSFDIEDSMCGFRIYPLKSTLEVINNCRVGSRMDFDPEIMVRMHWHQVRVISHPTKVIYYEDGISHFNLFHDNMLITKMHITLILGMIIRIPKLLVRKFKAN